MPQEHSIGYRTAVAIGTIALLLLPFFIGWLLAQYEQKPDSRLRDTKTNTSVEATK